MSLASQNQQDDTIFALSSAPGRAGVSVMRISGPRALDIAHKLGGNAPLHPRRASLRTLYHDDRIIDEAILLYFPGPNSFTGEDVLEIQGHGSIAIIEALSSALFSLDLRQAKAGEFTRRAVENGRMDLTEAEGLLDLIDAQSQAQHEQAFRQMDGALRETYSGWRERLLDIMAMVEGEIDFADEADVPDALSHAAYRPLQDISTDMEAALAQAERGQAVRDGLDVAIIGAPNAGKSTLLNALVGQDVAITSPQAGTTRDIVTANMIIAGLPVTLADTAGLRETTDEIEAEGVRRARQRSEDAHITLHLVRGTDGKVAKSPDDPTRIVLYNVEGVPGDSEINALSGDGLSGVLDRLETLIRETFVSREPARLTRERHRDCVVRARDHVHSAQSHLGTMAEFVSDDIRSALKALDELAGRSDIEEVFDRIFSQFCVGK